MILHGVGRPIEMYYRGKSDSGRSQIRFVVQADGGVECHKQPVKSKSNPQRCGFGLKIRVHVKPAVLQVQARLVRG